MAIFKGQMTCKNCNNDLIAKIEIDVGLCEKCIITYLGKLELAQNSLVAIEEKLSKSEKIVNDLLQVRNKRIELDSCFEGGKEAFSRNFSIEQDPHHHDSEESTMWKSGWLEAAREKEINDMRDYIRWNFELWVHVHELAANGCDHEEIRVKSTLSPARALQFIPEFLEEPEAGT